MKKKLAVAGAALTVTGPLLFVGATGVAHAVCFNPITNPGEVPPCPVTEQWITCVWGYGWGPACDEDWRGGRAANVKAVQRMLGHASAAMTLDLYASLFDDDPEAVATRLHDARTQEIVGISWARGSDPTR